ncbi:MAG: SDR family NAD(P)-dependent oxidoreductase [Solirubrobacterales bacterium]|nr:SDR family NAD(P)-dependent oxidoreductase [Solirubrobacterales bacterium]
MATEFTDKVCVITGAGSGIGRALSMALAREGARLALSDINAEGLAETASAAKAAGAHDLETYALDVADKQAVFAHADAVTQRFGGVDLVVNNAGVAVDKTVLEMPLEDFEWLMGINFWGVIYGSKAFLPALINSGDGHLVNLSSLFGLMGVPRQSAYNAAKFGVRGFTEALRQEMLVAKSPVQVHCVHPGGIKTNIARAARHSDEASSEELADRFEKIARLTPDQAAEIILAGVRKGRPRILVGNDAKALDLMVRVLGSGYQQLVSRGTAKMHP